MIWDWVEGDTLICDERQDPVPVRLPQVVSVEGVGSLLEVGTRDVVDCKGDGTLHARLPYISGLVVGEQAEELVHELWGTQLDGQCVIESLEVADEGLVPEYPRREGSMVGSAHCEGSAARQASIDVELYWVPIILVNEERAVGGGKESIKPG